MTGQCRLIVSSSDFMKFFETNSAKNYLENFALPSEGWNMNGGLDRVRYFHLHDILDLKTSFVSKVFAFAFLRCQMLLRVDRRSKNVNYFGGSGYYSLNLPAMDYFLAEYRTARKHYRHTYCAEEVAPQTILCNAPAEIRATIVNDNVRFVLWEEKHGEIPAILDEGDVKAMGQSNALFARKFDSRFSQKLAGMFR